MPSTFSILKYAHSVRLAYRLEEATAAWLSCPDASAETATEAAIKLEASSSAHPAAVQGFALCRFAVGMLCTVYGAAPYTDSTPCLDLCRFHKNEWFSRASH